MYLSRSAAKCRFLLVFLVVAAFIGGCVDQTQHKAETQVSALYTVVGDLQATMAIMATIQSYQATQIGLAEEEPIITTAAPVPAGITVTPSPTVYTTVYGSVLIEDGICCAGGEAGETIELGVAFTADSAAGEVVEMRFATSYGIADEERMAEESWIPFQAELTLSTRLAVNWVGWWISVQYRDSQGNVSPIYYDDISLEGH
jgi:hypothetical protein